jgi:hypothetical protein
MQRTTHFVLGFLLVSSVAVAQGQGRGRAAGAAAEEARGPITLSSNQRAGWAQIKGFIDTTARDLPEDMSYKPGYNTRTFGQVWGHMADARFSFCAAARGVPNPNKVSLQQTIKTKADALKAIADSAAFCDPAFASMTDAAFVETITPATAIEVTGTTPIPRGSILANLLEHDSIQYGYGVVYLRSIVPAPPRGGGAAAQPAAGRGNP